MRGKDIWSLAVAVKQSANDFSTRCDELYNYFCNHTDEIISESNDRVSFHVGSACYYMSMNSNDRESEQFILSTLSAFVNLYDALPHLDMQACIAAHRLFILIAKNDFIDAGFAILGYDLEAQKNPLFKDCTGVKRIKQLKIFAYHYLLQFNLGDEFALASLTSKEQDIFKFEFKKIEQVLLPDIAKTDVIKKGLLVMNSLKENFIGDIQHFMKTGHLIK